MKTSDCATSTFFDDPKVKPFEIPKTRMLASKKPARLKNLPKQSAACKEKTRKQTAICDEQHNPSLRAGTNERAKPPEPHARMLYAVRVLAGLAALLAYVSFMLPQAVLTALAAGLLETASMLAIPATVGLACGFVAVQRLMKQPSLPERMMRPYTNPHMRTSGSSKTP